MEIAKTLEMIKEQIGLELQLCDCFVGIKKIRGKKYFNVMLPEKVSESKEYTKLESFASQYKLISIEPNGTQRVAIFIN